MDMKSMAAALASMPEDQRKTMLRERLLMFAEMPDERRAEAMRQMMESVSVLPRQDIRKLFKTRFDILFELPESTRMKLMQTHMALLQQMGMDKMRDEMQLVQELMPELSMATRQGVEQMMKMMPMPAMSMGSGARATAGAVQAAGEPAQLAGWGQALSWIAAAGGVWLVVWPFLLGYSANGAIVVNNVILGVGIALVTAIVAIARQQATVGWVAALLWLTVLASVWVVVSPFVLNYGGVGAATIINVLSGLGIGILALIVAQARVSERNVSDR